ncbi:MAG: hypothetical protein ACLFP4_10765 [Spirochaetales bacterium]
MLVRGWNPTWFGVRVAVEKADSYPAAVAGMDEVITKPITKQVVIATIERVTDP